MKRWIYTYSLIVFLFIPTIVFGFTLNVTSANESCSGNGSLNFSVANTDPSGTITYIVYLLPDVTTPIASITANVLNGLSAGTYKIVARETIGNIFTTQEQTVSIASTIPPSITFTISSLNQACASTSNLIVTVTAGIPATYEIISGPTTFAPQASNIFTNLPTGFYTIRVMDVCGNGQNLSYTITPNVPNPTLSPPTYSSTGSCTTINATQTISAAAGTVIGYPLTILYTIHPPGGGADILINSAFSSGNPTSQDITTVMPLYTNQTYNYDVTLTDSCGTTYPPQNFIADTNVYLTGTINPLDCDKDYFTLNASNFTPPYTLNFTGFPLGFNPVAFNANYPGPYNQSQIDFGGQNNPTPLGNYNISITDACGRTYSLPSPLSIVSMPPTPSFVATNNGCLTNTETINGIILPNYKIVSAMVTSAPASYPFALPHDISSFIDATAGTIKLSSVPIGQYIITLNDNCGDPLTPITIPPAIYTDKGAVTTVLEGCDLQKGAVKLISLNGKLTSVIITAAPSGITVPWDVSNNIITSNGVFFMNDLPAGNYTFNTIDICNFTASKSVTIAGYTVTSNSYSLHANCGSFDIPLNFVTNASNETFWLQKYNATTNSWEHPGTDVSYVDGNLPTVTDSYPLSNNATTFNLQFNGTFRILYCYSSYNNGSDVNSGTASSFNKICFIAYNLPSFNQALVINSINRAPCSPTGSLDVVLNVTGAAPLHYYITKKNGLPFFLDNGNSNIFLNLAPGFYIFNVDDTCGDTRSKGQDVSALATLVSIAQPCDILNCVTTITGNETFDLTVQDSTLLGSQTIADYTLKYYASMADMDAGINPIANLTNYHPTSLPATIYARITYNQLPNCFGATTTFNLIVGQTPKINLNPTYVDCSANPVTLDASIGNLPSTTYLWSTGATTPQIIISQIGTTNISVTATNNYGMCNGNPINCINTENITVSIPEAPIIKSIETQDWTPNENSITVVTTNNGDFEYSLDGITYQNGNSFTDLQPGLYTVYVRDKNACTTLTQEVWLLYYPKFFTPNNDGINDTWFIPNSNFEPDFKVVIYDRYGKLLTAFRSDSTGWDGNYNGNLMFADDYWFVVYREDGRIHKGHFSLKR